MHKVEDTREELAHMARSKATDPIPANAVVQQLVAPCVTPDSEAQGVSGNI